MGPGGGNPGVNAKGAESLQEAGEEGVGGGISKGWVLGEMHVGN